MGQLFSRKVEAADEASTIPTSGSCNRTVELGSSIQINPVDEIKDVVVVSEEALPREADHGLGQVGIVIGKEDFIERSMPLVCEKEGEIRRKGPYTSDQKILLVGEGDFSFSVCLAVAFGSATNMVATSLDSREFLCENYKRAMRNILELTNRGCAVMHEIDATKMAKKYSPLHGMQFDRIIFNFPHAGVFNNDESRGARLRKNQKLISMFLANAKMMIKNDGEIHIRHKFKGFFREWKIQQLGEHEGLRLIEAVPFYLKEYEGYSTKLGYGGNEYFNCYPSKTYKFGLTESARSMGESGRRAEQSSKLGSLLELGEEPFARVKSSGEGGQVGGVAVPRVVDTMLAAVTPIIYDWRKVPADSMRAEWGVRRSRRLRWASGIGHVVHERRLMETAQPTISTSRFAPLSKLADNSLEIDSTSQSDSDREECRDAVKRLDDLLV